MLRLLLFTLRECGYSGEDVSVNAVIFPRNTLWLEMRNLNHLPFGMIMSLDIGLLHPSRLLRMKYLKKKWKRPKHFWRPHQRPDSKKMIFYVFFCYNMIKWLENSASVISLTIKAIKTKKATKRPNIRKSHIWKCRTQILLSEHHKRYS